MARTVGETRSAFRRRTLATALVLLASLMVGPAIAEAACPVGGWGTTMNRSGDVARFWNLKPMRGMNCPSAQYVMNKWLRRAFARRYSRRLPRSFYDGYVTWYCGKLSRIRWQCDEFDSGTSFRFRAAIIN